MIKLALLLILAIPAALFAQDVTYKMKPAGIAFMALAWICIITWNIICFGKILRNKK